MVFAALAVSRWIEDTTAWTIKRFVKAVRRYRTIQIRAGDHTVTAADPLPDDLRNVLAKINHGQERTSLIKVGSQCPEPTAEACISPLNADGSVRDSSCRPTCDREGAAPGSSGGSWLDRLRQRSTRRRTVRLPAARVLSPTRTYILTR